ncbi:putative adenylate kinase [Trypanosoma vivax]|uniref:Putative adenylate kinase n=1 Tax=Trypanosoma vivax (strain Y486) TaxID=1055687 RepID=G0U5Q0_TRYVY|nr:putative adenylate kinase [Trypanosoma vivax]CCC51201.1 putative adenylate kinase [Trypanosoma vivax Y486]
MKLIFMGPPGCGKGTQSPFIAERYNICHLSTGDMLRKAILENTQFGKQAKVIIDAGNLVSDEVIFGIVKESIAQPQCKNGYLLDGYPRTQRQALLMEEAGEKVDKVIHFDAPDDVIIARTSGRWIHPASGRTYHEIFSPPNVPQRDDITNEPLIQRPDDKEEVVRKRLDGYRKMTQPLIGFYESRNVLVHVDSTRSIELVRDTLRSILDPLAARLGVRTKQ